MSEGALLVQHGVSGDAEVLTPRRTRTRRGGRLLVVGLVVLAVVGAWAGYRAWSGQVTDGNERLVGVDTVEVVPDGGGHVSWSYPWRCVNRPGIACRSEISYSTAGGDIDLAATSVAIAAGDPVTATISWYRTDVRTNGQKLADAASREVFIVKPHEPWPLRLLDVRVLALVAVGWTGLQALVLRGVPGRRLAVTVVGTVMAATCAWVALNAGHNLTSYETTTWWATFQDALWWLRPLPGVVAVSGLGVGGYAAFARPTARADIDVLEGDATEGGQDDAGGVLERTGGAV